MAEIKETHYPSFEIKLIKDPSRFFAFPVVGFVIKIIFLIPVFIVMFAYAFAWLILWIINSFIISFSGKYWDVAYNFTLGFMRFYTRTFLYLLGLSNKYPGFGFGQTEEFSLSIKKPEHPNRLLAFPIIGLLIRIVALIPYMLFRRVMLISMRVSLLVAWYPILVDGVFPKSLYQVETDALLVNFRELSFIAGLRDSYPSFEISMDHKIIKVIIIILACIILLFQLSKSTYLPWGMQDQPRYYYPHARYMMQGPQYQNSNYNNFINSVLGSF